MGGEGSGNWYRFDKKTTIAECHSVDVRYLHREGLLNPGRWFSLRWSRADWETGSIRGVVEGAESPEQVTLLYRYRGGLDGEWEDVQERVSLDWTACNFGGEAVVHVSGNWMRPEGCDPVRAGEVFPVPSLLRLSLREPERERDAPWSSPGADDTGAP